MQFVLIYVGKSRSKYLKGHFFTRVGIFDSGCRADAEGDTFVKIVAGEIAERIDYKRLVALKTILFDESFSG